MHPVAMDVKKHWLTYRPKMSADMQKKGVLDKLATAAAELMMDTQADLVGRGMDYNQALEISRPMAYLPDEEDAPEL